MRTEERINQMNDIITGIARRSSYKFLTKTSEEIAQELWLHVLEKESEAGRDLDLDLIARICYNKIVDIQRHDMRRNSTSLESLIEGSDEDCPFNSQIDGPDDMKVMVEDLFRIFPEGSKERLFLEYWGTASGVKDFGVRGDGIYNDGYTEKDLASKLGFSGASSRDYKNFRNKMRIFVFEFFND